MPDESPQRDGRRRFRAEPAAGQHHLTSARGEVGRQSSIYKTGVAAQTKVSPFRTMTFEARHLGLAVIAYAVLGLLVDAFFGLFVIGTFSYVVLTIGGSGLMLGQKWSRWMVILGALPLVVGSFIPDLAPMRLTVPLCALPAALLALAAWRAPAPTAADPSRARTKDARSNSVIEPLFYCSMLGVDVLLVVLLAPMIMLGFGALDAEEAGGYQMGAVFLVASIGIVVLPAALIVGLLALAMGTWRLRLRVFVSALSLALVAAGVWMFELFLGGGISDSTAASIGAIILLCVVMLPLVWLFQLESVAGETKGAATRWRGRRG